MKREKHDWGTRFIERPFKDDAYIQADVSKRGVQVSFSGTLPNSPLRHTEVQIWISALQALTDVAIKESQEK